ARPAGHDDGPGPSHRPRLAGQPVSAEPGARRQVLSDRLERRARRGARRGPCAARQGADRRAPADSHPTGLPYRLRRDHPRRAPVRAHSLGALAGLLAACRASVPLPASAGIPPAAPGALGFDSTRLAAAAAYVKAAADSGAFPGAVLAVGRHGRLALLVAVGRYGADDPRPVDAGTIYDLASLTKVVGRITGESLDRFLERRVFRPLGMPATRYLPPKDWRERIAPTENDTSYRHRMLRGEVHDENAGRLGGISGHAGLFSNALDLSRFAALLLNGGAWDTLQLIRSETVADFTRRQGVVPNSSRALGWDTPPDPPDSTAS